MSHDYTSKPLYRQVMHFLENNEDMDFTDNTKKEIPESVVPVNRTKSTHDSHATVGVLLFFIFFSYFHNVNNIIYFSVCKELQ